MAVTRKPSYLPIVDPDYVTGAPDNPESLDAQARGLWEHWQKIESHGRSAAGSYPKATIKAATVQLVEHHAETKAPVSNELVYLVRAIISPEPNAHSGSVRPANKEAYWAAIMYEAKNPDTSLYAIAKHLLEQNLLPNSSGQKSAEATIKGWRKQRHYQDNLRMWTRRRPTGTYLSST